jgi:hypothetical protein
MRETVGVLRFLSYRTHDTPHTQGAFVKNMRMQLRVAALAGAIALVAQSSPVTAQSGNRQAPVEITFTKWLPNANSPWMVGVTGGDVAGTYRGEVLQRQVSTNPGLNGIVRLEAIYEVHDAEGNRLFTALIRGGVNGVTGAAILDGVVLAGWRTGAPVRVEFQTFPGVAGTFACADAPIGLTCFEGTIHVGRVPTASN